MSIYGPLRLQLVKAFERVHRELNRPALYAIPWQTPDTPSGVTYSADVDAWVDEDGDVVTKSPGELTYYAIPALWGADLDNLSLGFGGLATTGDLVAIAKAEYQSQLDGAMMVVTGSLSGDKYNLNGLENAPDGGAAIFVVARLRRREA